MWNLSQCSRSPFSPVTAYAVCFLLPIPTLMSLLNTYFVQLRNKNQALLWCCLAEER